MSSSTSAIFSGSSTFSKDFAQVITRAQNIASLPISLLNNQKTSLTAEQSALNGLSASFSSLQAALLTIGSAASGSNTAVSYSDNSVASATVTAGALPGVYTVEIVDPGSTASAMSSCTGPGMITDPQTKSISSATSFTLHANGKDFAYIVPASNSLSSLADAINSATKGEAHATIVNLGTSAAPSYQLSIQNTKYGALPITLDDGLGGPNFLGDPTSATSVQYRINGQPASPAAPLTSDSRALSIAPNLSVTALKRGTTDITVTQSTASIANALTSFVSAYNSAVTALDGQRGTAGGALAGQSIVTTLSQSLRDVTDYSAAGSISLGDLGISFDKTTYALTFDATVLSATAANDFKRVTAFLGSTTTGGFLKTANGVLNSVTDSLSGVIPTMLLSVAGEITETGKRISANQALVDQMTENLNAQMAAADALIASLQQQASYFTNMFAAMTANQNSTR